MMKILKVALITLLSTILLIYLAFLFVLPYAIDVNKFAPQIEDAVKNSVGFKLKTKNIKISTGWNLSAGLKLEKADLLYPTEKTKKEEKFAQVKNLEVK